MTPPPPNSEEALHTENAFLRQRVLQLEARQDDRQQLQNAALFSTLLEQAPMGVYVVDSHLRMQQVNKVAMPAFANVKPLIGRDLIEAMAILWGAELGQRCVDIFHHTLATGERYLSQPFSHPRNDLGVEQTYEWETQRITLPDGNFGVVCYFNEITERAQVAMALRSSEESFRAIFENVATGIAIKDWQGRVQMANSAYCTLLGYTEQEMKGKVYSSLVHPEDREHNLAETRRLQDEECPHFEIENRYLCQNGDTVWVRKFVSVLKNPNGNPTRLIALVTDITEQRKTSAILKANETAMAAQTNALREADRSKDEFLAMLAHELRNPLAPMRNAVQILQNVAAASEDHAHAKSTIDRQITNMSRMIDDLLDVSRITKGKINLQLQPIALESVITSAVSVARSSIASHNQRLTVSLPSSPVYLRADATRLEQVFGNLLTNACKYSGNGSNISIIAKLIGSEVAISVCDDGHGISLELLPRIFDLFVQSSRTLDRSQGGLGIGLTLVQRLVALHQGRVTAHSEGPGQGCKFTIHLPVTNESPAPLPSALQPPPPVGSLRMLIVDDNSDSASTLATLQKRCGHDTRVAFTGPSAVDVALAFLPEIILLDIGLPGMDGFEVACKLRQLPALSNALIIAMSGYGREEDLQRALTAGIDHYLVKPLNLAALTQIITSHFQAAKFTRHP